MAQVTQKVVEIKAKVEGEKTVKMLKDQIAELTHLMDTLDTESLEYHRTVDMLVDAQEELNTVMKAGKSQLSAQEGSYNALVNRMAALKKAQKAVTDEASRMRLGEEIRKINDQLKEIDANNGVYVRNVGNYENAIKSALKTPQQELKALRQQLAQLTEGTAEYNAVFSRMAQLTHDVTEQQEMLKWSSADLGDILGNVAGVATSLAGGFSAFNALSGLLGGESEELEKAMLQAQRFIQLIQGLEQLEQLGDKIKGLWNGIKNFNAATAGGATTLSQFDDVTTSAAGATSTLSSNLNMTQGAAQGAATSIREAADAMSEFDMATISGDVSLRDLQTFLNQQEDGLAKYARELANAADTQVRFQGSAGDMMMAFGDFVNVMREADDEMRQLSARNTALMKTNLQLKDTLATTHKWQILTRAATKAQIRENEALIVGNTMLATSFKVAAVAAKTLKVAIASTGIGLLIVALGELIALLGKGLGKLWGWISGANKAAEQTEALKTAFDDLNESLDRQEKIWERQEMLMDAQGKSYEEIYEARRKNLQAQLAETQALLATQRAIANDIGQRKLQKKKYDEFRETLDELVAKEKELKETIDDLDYKNYIDDIKARKKAEEEAAAAAKKAADEAKAAYNKQKEEADKLYKSLIEHYKTERQKLKEKYDKEKAMLEKYGKDTTLLTKKYEEEKTNIILKEADERRKLEEKRQKNEKSLLTNPSLDYFKYEIDAARERYNALVDINNKIAKKEVSLKDGLAEASGATGMEIKTVEDLKMAFKLLAKDIEIAKAALASYKQTIEETTSNELVQEIEAQIAAIEALVQMEQRKIDQEYLLYESSNNYYTDFENNYISQMYKRWEAEDAIHQMRIANLQEMMRVYKEASENTMLTEEERIEAARKAAEIEAQITQENTDHIINSNYRKTEAADNYVTAVQDSLSGISQILGDVASAWETSIKAQVDAGEISEEEGEKQMENMKGIQSAIALINALSSAVSAYNSMASIPYVGPALGAAAAAAALASGIAQVVAINKVKKGDKGGGDSTRYAEAIPTMPDYNPTSVTNITGGQETENLANAMTKSPIWVSVKDIDNAQSRVKTREKESTF